MAETPLKRQREEEEDPHVVGESEDPKRQKSYNQILSLLEEEEDHQDQPNQELSSIFSTLERELSCDSSAAFDGAFSDAGPESGCGGKGDEDEEDDEEREKVMRHLLEASDDELGIPNSERLAGGEAVAAGDGGEAFPLCDELLWELEDEAANYYTMLQSELFL